MSTISFAAPQHHRSAPRPSAPAGVRHLHAVPSVAQRPAQLRLTRRGRVVVFIAGLIVIALASLAFGASSVATQKAGQPVATETIVVGSGQTLWDIASDIAAQTGEEDVRDVMHEIKQLNALESGMLMAGQRLRVPAAGADAGE